MFSKNAFIAGLSTEDKIKFLSLLQKYFVVEDTRKDSLEKMKDIIEEIKDTGYAVSSIPLNLRHYRQYADKLPAEIKKLQNSLNKKVE